MSNTQHRASRCVFVGNIPYDATEEQLVHICEEVGPVVNFRLVLDRETGKPKGYGFCEFRDEETALSARRNLQGYEINGRQLRVDFAENEKGGGGDRNREQRQGGQGQQPAGFSTDTQRQSGTRQVGSNIEPDRSGEPPIGQATAVAAAQFLTGTLGGNQQQQQQYAVSMNGQSMPVANGTAATVGNDQLTSHLAGMSKQQLFEVMVQMKTMIQQNQQQARQVLMANPQLTKAIFQAQIMLGMVRPPQMNQAMLPTQQQQQPQQQQQQQQRTAVPPAPTNLMQQPPLPPQPRPVQPPVIPGQVQQPMNYQPQQLQQPLPQAPFQHQGGMVQQSSGMSMSYVQQGVPPPPSQPPPQPQYQMLQQNSRMDGSSGPPSIGQAGMVSGSEAVLPTGPVMGPVGIPQMGRNMNMPQAGQVGSMGPGAPMNQPSPPSGPSGIPGQVMHGLVMGAGQPMGSGNQPLLNTGVPVSSGPSLIGAPLVPDSQSRPNYGNQAGISDGGVPSASPMQPHPYGQMPMQGQVPQQQPPMAGELEQQKALLQQVLSLTPEQINSLPPEQRQQVLQLQQALRT